MTGSGNFCGLHLEVWSLRPVRARYDRTQICSQTIYIYIHTMFFRDFCRQHMCFAVYLATFGLQERPDKICCHLLGS